MSPLNDNEAGTVWIGSCRYYLGRMTYAVSDFAVAVIRHGNDLPVWVQKIIKSDVEKAFEQDDADRADGKEHKRLGHDCDRASWEMVRRLWE